jgi:hypothetical protein
MPATLWPRAERLDGMAAAAAPNGAVGVGPATAASVSTRNAPRTSATIHAVRIAGLAEAPTLFELRLFCPARSAFGKRNLTPQDEMRRRIAIPPLAAAQGILLRHPQSSRIEARR